jgi:NAD(P)-dependent dehydrogenase (short-subunit alcohol dehydrogenase family)
MIHAAAPLAAIPPTLLAGRRIAVLGSGGGLGRAVARAAQAAGAEVLGIGAQPVFDHVSAFYRADPGDMQAVAAALPEGLDGLALFPDLTASEPAQVLAQGVIGPRLLAHALAPRMARGASIVVRAAPMGDDWAATLSMIRAAMALRPDDLAGFVPRWGLAAEPTRAPRLAGWAMGAWAMANRWTWAGVRVNALTPATPDGRLPPAIAAQLSRAEGDGPDLAAQTAVFLLSALSQGLTGANIAADGGMTAQMQTSLHGI